MGDEFKVKYSVASEQSLLNSDGGLSVVLPEDISSCGVTAVFQQ